MEITDIKLPEGFEAKFEGKTLVVTKGEGKLDTWEKCVRYLKEVEYLDLDCIARKVIIDEDYSEDYMDHNFIPKDHGEKLLALMQLIVCRNAWWKKYNCGINESTPTLYIITCTKKGDLKLDLDNDIKHLLSFNNQEIRGKFFETFYTLIVKAKDLI